MLKPQVLPQTSPIPTLPPLHKSCFHSSLPIIPSSSICNKIWGKNKNIVKRRGFHGIKAMANDSSDQKVNKVTAFVTVKPTISGVERVEDDTKDLLEESLLLELVSTELDPNTRSEKETIKGRARQTGGGGVTVKYEAQFQVPVEFGEIGAVVVENEHHKEMFLHNIVLKGLLNGSVDVSCESWVHSKLDNPEKRVFFTNKSYLPSKTPDGLGRIREKELEVLRGNGQGERKSFERVYDYDVYNDLGDPDNYSNKKRPVLGGAKFKYPRRCRTGRPYCETDPKSEIRSSTIYVPKDEAFSKAMERMSSAVALELLLETNFIDADLGFSNFMAIDQLFKEGINLPPLERRESWKMFLGGIFKAFGESLMGFKTLPTMDSKNLGGIVKAVGESLIRFKTPPTMDRDKFFWLRDGEFARQTLAGLNPYSLELVTEWPLKSNLDPEVYGPAESAITTDMIEEEIKGFMTLEEAIKQKKLFILDYHDLYLPYVQKVREIEGTTLYGSRTLFFLSPDETLRPLAIELTRPQMDGKPQWRQVFRPAWDSTSVWLWRLAKAHVLAHDTGYHQLVSHWLRTHCCTEPYIIATNRQLSRLHPIYKLLHPHFRHTMGINALARAALINAGGIIESSFSPGKYSTELSAVAYDLQWRFDHEALPADLISRGLAVEDPYAPHGLQLTIKDYPFANDGLLLWDALKEWNTAYVKHYYPDDTSVQSDKELQAWWTEIRTVGHGDKKDEPWWPALNTPEDLIHIVTTMAWVSSGHHAAVNFGQYAYGAYFPNRPTIARINMPVEEQNDEAWKSFSEKPEALLLQCFPSKIQATSVMATLDVLSTHSPDEVYLGDVAEPAWAEDPCLHEAFEVFKGKLKEIDGIIDERNTAKHLKNRNGVGTIPYELLKPFSVPEVTGKGVPYSISI